MTTEIKTWRILDLLKASESALKDKGISSPRLNAEVLLADSLGIKRIDLYLQFEKPLDSQEISAYKERIKRRLLHEPLQYITGRTEFYALPFNVNPSVLIPRQETELLVEKTLEAVSGRPGAKILEIGTGSGCISIAVAANADVTIEATDITKEAVATAEANSKLNGTQGKITFRNQDFLKSQTDFSQYDIIISNPPYIDSNDISGLDEEVCEFEPVIALTDGGDGLEFYRRIFAAAESAEGPLDILLELGDGKKKALDELLKNYSTLDYTFYKDLIGFYRVLHIKVNKQQ